MSKDIAFTRVDSRSLRTILFASTLFGCAAITRGEVVYENLATPLDLYVSGAGVQQVADDVFLDGSARIFQSVSVAYNAFSVADDATITMSLYAMDGPGGPASFGFDTPGTVLFQQTLPLVNSDSWLATFSDNSGTIILPDHVGVGLAFTGIDLQDPNSDAGPLLLDPPTVGSSFPDFWILQDGIWGLYLIGDPNTPLDERTPANFGLQIVATPDSGTWLNLCALPLLLGLHNFVSRARTWPPTEAA